jgi:hypothetical protein
MISYAIYDVFSTTYLIRPVLENWTFQKLKNANVIELFTSFKLSPLPPLPANNSSNKKIKKNNINLQKLFNIIDDKDLEPISDDDEIYLSQIIGPVTNKQPDYEEISMVEHELNDKLPINNVELITNEVNESIIDGNEEIKSMENVEKNLLHSNKNQLINDDQGNRDEEETERETTHIECVVTNITSPVPCITNFICH